MEHKPIGSLTGTRLCAAVSSISLMAFASANPPAPAQSHSKIMTQRIGSDISFKGDSLIQVCVGVNDPSLAGALPLYDLVDDPANPSVRTPCDVFPIARDAKGLVTSVHVVAPFGNPSGSAAIPDDLGVDIGTTPYLVPGLAPVSGAGTFKMEDLEDLKLTVKPSNTGPMVCHPLDQSFSGFLGLRDTLRGKYVRQRVFASQFVVRNLPGKPVNNEDAALVVYAILTERTDFPAATLDLIVANSAYDPTYNSLQGTDPTNFPFSGPCTSDHPNAENESSDGPFFFSRILMDLPNDDYSAELLAPRPGSYSHVVPGDPIFSANTPRVNIVEPLDATEFPNGVNAIFPGSYFVRRLCLFEEGTRGAAKLSSSEIQAISSDIAHRRDFGWSTGDIGYVQGGYGANEAKTPDFGKQRPFGYINSSGLHRRWRAVHERGVKYEADQMADLNAPANWGLSPNVPAVSLGWFKPASPGTPLSGLTYPAGEVDIEFSGYTWPSNGEMVGRLVRGDRYMERSHLAVSSVKKFSTPNQPLCETSPFSQEVLTSGVGWPMTDTEYVKQGGGYLSTGFSAVADSTKYIIPQHSLEGYTPTWATGPSTKVQSSSSNLIQSATMDMDWNQPGASEIFYFADVYNWANNSGRDWGPFLWSHSSIPMAMWRANAFGLNDTASWMAIEFTANAYSLGLGRFEPLLFTTQCVPGNRDLHGVSGNPNLHFFDNDLQAKTWPQLGFWAEGNGGIRGQDAPRFFTNPLAFIAANYAHATDCERRRWQTDEHLAHSPTHEHDIRHLISNFYGHIITPAGFLGSSAAPSGAAPHPYYLPSTTSGPDLPCDIAVRTGSMPGGPHNPAGSNNNNEIWSYVLLYQQAYGYASMLGLEQSMLKGTIFSGAFDRAADVADAWGEFSDIGNPFPTSNDPDEQETVYFPHFHTTSFEDSVLGVPPSLPGSSPVTDLEFRNGDAAWYYDLYTAGRFHNSAHLTMLAAWHYYKNGGSFGDSLKGVSRTYERAWGGGGAVEEAAISDMLWSQFTSFTAGAYADAFKAAHLVPILGVLP